MKHIIAAKDLTILSRETIVRGLFLVAIALVLISTLTGVQRERVFDVERSAALITDKSVWMGQGDRNPHSAAHFSRYAFRPTSPLGIVDPGTSDFAGLAIWMEAHYQDPAIFRRAEDSGELSRYAQLTPAFLFIAIAPLIVFSMLFGSIAAEREDGTLRQLLATGVSVQQFFLGKLSAGLRLTMITYTLVFVPVTAFSIIASPVSFDADVLLRAVALYATYGFYLTIFVAIGLGLSALFRTRQGAFLTLACVWTLLAIVVPRLAMDLGTHWHPQPDARQTAERLSAASNTFYIDKDRRKRIDSEVLKQYSVSSIEDLPINYGAYILQTSEELSVPEFDQLYSDLNAQYTAQESTARWFSLLTPTLTATSLSQGIAGTDRLHQTEFAQAAEKHRRKMIRMLNEDYMYNADNAGTVYTSDEQLWAQFDDFDHQMPSLAGVLNAYIVDALILLAWLIMALLVAYTLVARAVRGEVPTA